MPAFVIELVGAFAATLTTVCWLPQSIKTIRTRNTRDLSLWTNALLLTGMVLWLAYGIAIGSWPLIAANAVSGLLVATIVVLKARLG